MSIINELISSNNNNNEQHGGLPQRVLEDNQADHPGVGAQHVAAELAARAHAAARAARAPHAHARPPQAPGTCTGWLAHFDRGTNMRGERISVMNFCSLPVNTTFLG